MPKKPVYSGDEVIGSFLPDLISAEPTTNSRRFYMSNWTFFCSLQLIKSSGWRFESERTVFSEDVYSQLKLYPHVTKVAVVCEPLYYYCDENASSISRQGKTNQYERIKHFYVSCIDLCDQIGYGDEIKHRSKSMLSVALKKSAMRLLRISLTTNYFRRCCSFASAIKWANPVKFCVGQCDTECIYCVMFY